MLAPVTLVLHLALMLAAAPLAIGLLRLLRARLVGRVGPPVTIVYRDLRRLLRKQQVIGEGTSFVFRGAPYVTFAATFAATALVPSFALGMASARAADLLVIAGLLGLARCAMALAGLDAGTAFGGIGASRSMAYGVFAEPALLLVFLTFALVSGTTNLDTIATLMREGGFGLRVSLGLAIVATIAVALAELGRLPVDNPATHLELTMVHEATTLEYSGRALALVEVNAAFRLTLWITLIGTLFLPFGIAPENAGPVSWLLGIGAWAAKTMCAILLLAVFETVIARMRIFRVPEFLGIAVLLGLLAAVFLFVSQGLV